MTVFSIRTDKPEAEIAIFANSKLIDQEKWEAHRSLAETIHSKIKALLKKNSLGWQDIDGLVCYKGPGSFTGLRIGLSVGNTLAYSLNLPIVGSTGSNWLDDGLKALAKGSSDQSVLPEYGAPVHITAAKK
jgi:tRNA threonylcarbamoyladenosine biosynthesis protein TsaB